MKIFIGSYWVPFPSSEYGGSWVVIAKDRNECIEVLERGTTGWGGDQKYNDRIFDAVEDAKEYDLVGEHKSRIVEMFTT